MMYVLLQKRITTNGTIYRRISEAEELDDIASRLKSMVISGEPLADFRVVKDVEFKFDCDVKFSIEDCS